MTLTELEALKSKYQNWQFSSIRFAEASADVNQLLDALPAGPRNTLLRKKYADDDKVERDIATWNVLQDVELLWSEVVPVEPELPPAIPPVNPEIPSTFVDRLDEPTVKT